MGILCVSVDMDEIRCYHDIHGLGDPPAKLERVIYRRSLQRIGDLFERLGISGTLFLVGRDLREDPRVGDALWDMNSAGHELANHSMNHRYDLTMLSSEDQSAEIAKGARAIQETTGIAPKGFRAPGYNVHLGLLDIVEEQGYNYDSSVFPCPTYVAAKAGAMAWKSVRGKPSRSVMGDPRVLLAPTGPYRLGRDGVWTTGEGMCELPITVVTPARLPFIGTSLTLMGSTAASIMGRSAARLGFVNLELHGIDFMDAEGDGVGHLTKYQPDLRISLTKKLAILEKVIGGMLDSGMQAMTLDEASRRVLV